MRYRDQKTKWALIARYLGVTESVAQVTVYRVYRDLALSEQGTMVTRAKAPRIAATCAVTGCGNTLAKDNRTTVCRKHMHGPPCACAGCKAGVEPSRVAGRSRGPVAPLPASLRGNADSTTNRGASE
jgi:hypothetical protein